MSCCGNLLSATVAGAADGHRRVGGGVGHFRRMKPYDGPRAPLSFLSHSRYLRDEFFSISVWREMQQSPLVVAFAAGKAKWRPVEFGHQIWSHLFCLGIIVPCCRFLVRQQRNSQAWQVGS